MRNIYELFTLRLKCPACRGFYADAHRAFLKKTQSANGGFYGRNNSEDVYYTYFGLLGERKLGIKHPAAKKTAEFLGKFEFSDLPHVYSQVASLNMLKAGNRKLFAETKQKVLPLESGGGFRRLKDEKPSIYHTLMAVLILREIGHKFERSEKERMTAFVMKHGTSDGGFSSLVGSKAGMANQTSAAVAILFYLDELDRLDRDAVCKFYRSLVNEDGGYCAAPNIPVSDLLSTYTSCLALMLMDRSREIEKKNALEFVLGLQKHPGGGFMGSVFDPLPDTEYTFYGLHLMNILAG